MLRNTHTDDRLVADDGELHLQLTFAWATLLEHVGERFEQSNVQVRTCFSRYCDEFAQVERKVAQHSCKISVHALSWRDRDGHLNASLRVVAELAVVTHGSSFNDTDGGLRFNDLSQEFDGHDPRHANRFFDALDA